MTKRTSKRDKYLKAKYGIDERIYKLMLAHGKGACWICRRKPKPGKHLNVDHEHARKKVPGSGGQVRGLLCYFCNKFMVGRRRREHAGLFDRTAGYLRSTKDWRYA